MISFFGRSSVEERGQIIFEFAIVLPFILFLMAFVLDLGRALHQYMTITQVANEALRTSMSLFNLEAEDGGEFTNVYKNGGSCSLGFTNTPGSPDPLNECPNHVFLQLRAFELMDFFELIDRNDSATFADLDFVSGLTPAVGGSSADTVYFRVRMPFEPFLDLFGVWVTPRMTYEARAPYLFENFLTSPLP